MNRRRHQAELDTHLRELLNHVLACEPKTDQMARTLDRIKSLPDSRSGRTTSPKRSLAHKLLPHRFELAAACCLAFVLCLIASTDAWAEVAMDYTSPQNEPQPISTLIPEPESRQVGNGTPGFGRRVLLLGHVASLTLGLLAMAVSWLVDFATFLYTHIRRSGAFHRSRRIEKRVLATGLLLYCCGVVLGGIWSQLTWGAFWRWDPKEVVCLLSLAFGVLWLGLISQTAGAGLSPGLHQAKLSSWKTLAFGSIFLLLPIGSTFAASQQTHAYPNFPSPFSTIATSIVFFFASCIAAIWLLWFVRRNGESAAASLADSSTVSS